MIHVDGYVTASRIWKAVDDGAVERKSDIRVGLPPEKRKIGRSSRDGSLLGDDSIN